MNSGSKFGLSGYDKVARRSQRILEESISSGKEDVEEEEIEDESEQVDQEPVDQMYKLYYKRVIFTFIYFSVFLLYQSTFLYAF